MSNSQLIRRPAAGPAPTPLAANDNHASVTMTSRDIAELVELRHDNVKRTIETLADRGVITLPQSEEVRNPGPGPKTIAVYRVGKRDSYVIVAQLSPEFTARLVDRWQELEEGVAPSHAFQVPTTLASALRLAAEQAEQIELQQAQLQQQAPAVAFVERYVEAKNSLGVREVAKVLNVRQTDFVRRLIAGEIMFRQNEGGPLLPYAKWQNKGYFEVKTGNHNEHDWVQVKFTPLGIAWIAKKLYRSEQAAATQAVKAQ